MNRRPYQSLAFTMQADYHSSMNITSPSFENGQPIPVEYSCKGSDISPPLEWSDVPSNAVTLALICDDPDAPMGTWVHWVYFDIPAGKNGLPQGVDNSDMPAIGGVQGKNSWRKNGYGGPCPPGGTHRYFFKLFAVDSELRLAPTSNKAKVLKALEGHVIDEAQLMGTFTR